MLNCLISHGTQAHSTNTPPGTIDKDKINLIADAVTKPFAEMVWLSSGGDAETINRLTSILTSMDTQAEREALFRLIQMLHGLLGIRLSKDTDIAYSSPETLEYFLFSFVCDFGEVMRDYLSEQA